MIFRPTGIAGISPSCASILRRISGFAYRRHFRVVALLCCHVQAGPWGWVSGICGWGFIFTERKQPFASDMMAIVITVKYIAGVYCVECWVKINTV